MDWRVRDILSAHSGEYITALDVVNIHLKDTRRHCDDGIIESVCTLITPQIARAVYFNLTGKYRTFTTARDFYYDLDYNGDSEDILSAFQKVLKKARRV